MCSVVTTAELNRIEMMYLRDFAYFRASYQSAKKEDVCNYGSCGKSYKETCTTLNSTSDTPLVGVSM